MEDISAKWEEANRVIDVFKTEFKEKFNAEIFISYAFNQQAHVDSPKIPMECILDEINHALVHDYPNGLHYNDPYNKTIIDLSKEGIRTKCRIPAIITYRYLFYRICVQLGYSHSQISRFIKGKQDHSIVIHGCRKFQNLLDVKDIQTVQVHQRITFDLNNKYNLKLK